MHLIFTQKFVQRNFTHLMELVVNLTIGGFFILNNFHVMNINFAEEFGFILCSFRFGRFRTEIRRFRFGLNRTEIFGSVETEPKISDFRISDSSL